MKVVHIRYIGIDVVPDGFPFIELQLELHILDEDENLLQITPSFGRVYKRISDLHPIPIGNIADDGYVDNYELLTLVATAALAWVAEYYNVSLDEKGRVVIE